jgi:DNA-binding IclR family transcriptional regulator
VSQAADEAVLKHTIPVIDRMMDVLGQLERRSSGATIRDLTAQLALPRTTIYRILNTLQRHDVVRRDQDGAYHLGRRLLTFASHVSASFGDVDLAAVGQPFLDRLAGQLGEGCKLSVIDHEGLVVLAAAQGGREYALSVAPGQHLPIHAGAAGKLLLAFLAKDEQAAWMARPLIAFTPRTITDPRRLRSEVTRIKRLGWAQDKGENITSIHAFAAPVIDRTGTVVAAISVPFLAGTAPSRMEEIRLAAIEAAGAMSAAMPA